MRKFKNMSDEDKKIFAAVIAFLLTAIIAVSWFVLGPKRASISESFSTIVQGPQADSLKQSIQESMDQFNAMKAEIFGTTTATSTATTSVDANATTTIASSTMSTT